MDIKFIRQNPDKVRKGAQDKGRAVDVKKILEIDTKQRALITEVQKLKSQQNEASRGLKDKPSDDLRNKLKSFKEEIKTKENELEKIEKELNSLINLVPNLPLDEVPHGTSSEDNAVIKEVGEKKHFSFTPKDYLDLGENLDLIDIKRAAKVAGGRFGYLRNEAVLFQFALINYVLDTLTNEKKINEVIRKANLVNLSEKPFVPVVVPDMLKKELMWAMGYLDYNNEEVYHLEKDDLYLIGTAEQPLGAMHRNEILKEEDLPLRYLGYSTCFRREAGSYGKDVKGILRVHQFDKLEMFSFAHPEESLKEHQFFVALEERLMQGLEIPYRLLQLCAADIYAASASSYDIEAWLPGSRRWMETHTTSHCTDFQAERLNIRFKTQDKETKKPVLKTVHTLNGTALAIGRALIAILENYQEKDSSVSVPKALQKYLKFKKIR